MAQTLFIDIFAFNLQKIKESHNVTTPTGGIGTRYTTEKENSKFNALFECLSGESYEDKFKSLIQEYIGSFNDRYSVKREKGISMNSEHHLHVSGTKFYIWGEFSGGHTGHEQRVYKRENSSESEYTISKEKMVASPFFFLLWIPRDSNLGILIVQRYSSMSCTKEFQDSLVKLFIAKGFKPIWTPFVPKEICKEYFNTCALTAFRVQHTAPKSDDFNDTVFAKLESDRGISFVTRLSGMNLSFEKLFKTGKFKEDFKGFIGMVDKNYTDGDDVEITYKNCDGITTKASLETFDSIMPRIALESDCFDEETNTPIWDKISVTAISYLESIKKDIGYTPTIEE